MTAFNSNTNFLLNIILQLLFINSFLKITPKEKLGTVKFDSQLILFSIKLVYHCNEEALFLQSEQLLYPAESVSYLSSISGYKRYSFLLFFLLPSMHLLSQSSKGPINSFLCDSTPDCTFKEVQPMLLDNNEIFRTQDSAILLSDETI